MRAARDLLQSLTARGVTLVAEEGQLRYHAPRGIITGRVLEDLRRHKADLLVLLGSRDDLLARFLEERREALAVLDETAIRRFCWRWGMDWGAGRQFWVRVHRHRSWARVGLSEGERQASEDWLRVNAAERGESLWEKKQRSPTKRRAGKRRHA